MANTKSIKVQLTFPAGLHARLVAHAERSGLPLNQALLSLVDRSVAINCNTETRTTSKKDTPKDLERQDKDLQKRIKPYNDKLENGTITYAECDERYALIEQLMRVRNELGTESRDPDEIMQAHYNREIGRLLAQHNAEEDDLFNPDATPIFHKQYKERAERLEALKDRLK